MSETSTPNEPNEPATGSWVCPACRGELLYGDESLACSSCGAAYPRIGGRDGIPDFRVPELAGRDLEADRADAWSLFERAEHSSAEDTIRRIFAARSHWTQARIERRTREILTAPERLDAQLGDWLKPALDAAGPLLDIGCGPGGLLCAAAARGAHPIGIDTSLAWLIVARVVLRERGLRAEFAAAYAEALPLADASIAATVSLDVIEHVHSAARMLGQVDRVTREAGVFLFSTPNRYSLAAEPHVGVWGVGWLPRAWQARYVMWRRGDAYDGTQLLGGAEIARLVSSNTRLDLRLETPGIPDDELANFPPYRAALARIYNRLAAMGALRPLWLLVAPFFRATCRSSEAA